MLTAKEAGGVLSSLENETVLDAMSVVVEASSLTAMVLIDKYSW
jgi:hypothetical protein